MEKATGILDALPLHWYSAASFHNALMHKRLWDLPCRNGFFVQARLWWPIGPPATLNREPRQARKGATVVVAACAGMWLVGRLHFWLSPILATLFASSQAV
jgi:hypothetical protein